MFKKMPHINEILTFIDSSHFGTSTLRRRGLYETETYGYDYVDMEEAGIWATCNIGAHSPEEQGLYFAWGENQGYTIFETSVYPSGSSQVPNHLYGLPKKYFNWNNYKWCSGTKTTITKYCSSDSYGIVDNKKILDPEDDAAYRLMGKKWRMPSYEDLSNLINYCTCELTQYNNKNGYLLTLKTNPSKSIFFPVNNLIDEYTLHYIGDNVTSYISNLNNSQNSYFIYINKTKQEIEKYALYRCYGTTIRGVLNEVSPVNSDYVDFGLSVKWAVCNIGASTEEETGLYFAYGEIQGYDINEVRTSNNVTSLNKLSGTGRKYFGWQDYKWCNGSETTLTKYNSNYSNGTVDNIKTLEPEDDAAYMLLGRHWRTPTVEEFQELINVSSNTRLSYNNGRYCMQFINWHNNAMITLPGAGYIYNGNHFYANNCGYYMTSSPKNVMKFVQNDISIGTDANQCSGWSIRAVLDIPKEPHRPNTGTSSIAMDIGNWSL